MANRRLIAAVAAITALFMLPAAVYAGAGGGPGSPGAGGGGVSTAYCCTGGSPAWETVILGKDILRQDIIVFRSLPGITCSPTDTPATCLTGEVRKCRGELFVGTTGAVLRCFSP